MVVELLPSPELSLFVPGRPAPQGSKRHVGNGVMVEMSKYVKPWRSDIRDALIAEWDGKPPLYGPIALELAFVMQRPASLSVRKPTPPAVKRPDWDKLSRAVCDAITSAQVYKDDSQIVHAVVSKRIAEVDELTGCWIHIYSKLDG